MRRALELVFTMRGSLVGISFPAETMPGSSKVSSASDTGCSSIIFELLDSEAVLTALLAFRHNPASRSPRIVRK